MGSGAFIAAAVAAHVVHEHYRREAEDRRRAQEARHREEERRRREEDDRRRREEQERQRRQEEEHRRREADTRKRRFNDKLKNGNQSSPEEIDFSLLQFTDKLVISQDDFPAIIRDTEFEIKYANGSYATYEVESVVQKDYNDIYRTENRSARCLHLPNGVIRTYTREKYSDDKQFHLIREELPDGRMKTYDFHQNVLFERDAEGNYKCYEHHRNNDSVVLIEEGTKNGWTKRYEYESKYQNGKYVITETKEINNEDYSDKQGIEFTDKLLVDPSFFPTMVAQSKFEGKYADGSYVTYDVEDVVQKDYNDIYRTENRSTRTVHLPNGVTRTYTRERYSDDKQFHLIREELPDGRVKAYDFHQNVLFERDAEGNYKCYEHHRNNDSVVLTEEGTKDGWSKRYEYESKYQNGQYVITSSKVTFSDGKYQIFDGKQHLLEEVDGDTYRRYYPNAKNTLKEEKDKDGNIHKWSEHGQLLEEALADGTIYRWNEFEVMTFEKLPTGEETHWNNQGVKTYESFKTEECRQWNDKGVMIYEALLSGEKRQWNDKGKMLLEELPDGSCHKWNDKGVMIYEKLSTGEVREWNDKGIKTYELLAKGEKHKWNDKGIMIYEKLPNKELRQWNDAGVMTYEALPTGEIREWNDNGSKTREVFADGSETHWFPDTTKVSYKKKRDGSFQEYDELGRVIKEGTPEYSYVYRYYGDSKNVLDRCTFDAKKHENKSAYVHYDKKGNEDTEHYKTLKKIAKERMEKEDKISKEKGKKTILPKMSSLKKAVVYHQQLRKMSKEK